MRGRHAASALNRSGAVTASVHGSYCPSSFANTSNHAGGGGGGASSHAARVNGYALVAQSLARAGIKLMYGVIGIPVTELASAAQVCASSTFFPLLNAQSARSTHQSRLLVLNTLSRFAVH